MTQITLDQIMKHPDNRYCADCSCKGPRWASVNLGVLMCIDCSGIHRNLGVHISNVKSLTLDTWRPVWIETVSKIGNVKANAYYEARLPAGFSRPTHAQGAAGVEAFIRAKYQRKEYAAFGAPAPHELVANGTDLSTYNYSSGSAPTAPATLKSKDHASSGNAAKNSSANHCMVNDLLDMPVATSSVSSMSAATISSNSLVDTLSTGGTSVQGGVSGTSIQGIGCTSIRSAGLVNNGVLGGPWNQAQPQGTPQTQGLNIFSGSPPSSFMPPQQQFNGGFDLNSSNSRQGGAVGGLLPGFNFGVSNNPVTTSHNLVSSTNDLVGSHGSQHHGNIQAAQHLPVQAGNTYGANSGYGGSFTSMSNAGHGNGAVGAPGSYSTSKPVPSALHELDAFALFKK